MMKWTALLAITALLTACGGGGATQSTLPTTPQSAHNNGVLMTIAFPATASSKTAGARSRDYVPIDTHGIGIDFGPSPMSYSHTANPTPMVGAAIVAGSGFCGPADPTGKYSCTIYIPNVPIGYDDFKVSLWSTVPAGCVYPAESGCTFSGSALSTTVIPYQAVKAGQTNTFDFGFSSTVDSIYVSLGGGIVDGTASPTTVTLTEKDANGYIILNSPQFFDKNGNPLTITLNIANDLGLGCPAAGAGNQIAANGCSLYFGGSANPAFTSVGATSSQVTISYDGTQQFPSSGATQPAVTVSLNVGAALGGTTLGAKVSVTQTNLGGLGVPGVPQVATVATLTNTPQAITLGSDGKLWVAEGPLVATVTTAGGLVENATPAGGTMTAITGAGDGYLWYYDSTAKKIDRFSPGNLAGVQFGASPPASLPYPIDIAQMVMGLDGNMYADDNDNEVVDVVQPNNFGAAISFLDPGDAGATALAGIAVGPRLANGDPTICVVDENGPDVACADTATAPQFTAYCTPPACSFGTTAGPTNIALVAPGAPDIVTAQDGTLYVGESGLIETFSVGAGASVTGPNISLTIPSGGNVTGMAVGHDGDIWFTTDHPSIGKVTPSASSATIQEYTTGTGMPATASPLDLILGPGPNYDLYFVDQTNNTVDSITP